MPDESEPEGDDSSALRSVGEGLFGFARRVGEIVADAAGRPIPTDAIREPLANARIARLEGEHAGALTSLRALAKEHEGDPFVLVATGVTFVHDLLAGGRPLRPLKEVTDAVDDALGRGPKQLLQGALELYGDRPDRALDHFRRAAGDFGRLPDDDEVEARFLIHLLAGLAHLGQGTEERALRELQKARARMPAEAGPALRSLVLRHGVELSLAAGEVGDAQAWIRESIDANAEDPNARELLCRVLASKGDRVGAHSLLEELGHDAALDGTRVWVGLTVGLPAEEAPTTEVALRYMQSDSEDQNRRRLWALAQLAADHEPSESLTAEIMGALLSTAAAAPEPMRDRYLQEAAHAALRLDRLSDDVLGPIEKRLSSDEGTAPEELRLVRARARLQRGEGGSPVDFRAGEPPRFRADPDLGRPWGPDPRSPVRNPDLRASVLASQRRLAAAELCLDRGQTEVAQDLLVDALVEWPPLRRARELLASIVQQTSGARLEDLLGAATRLLAAVPGRVLGVGLEGVQEALGRVIAARERLARPLTIAIMGEFSAGKSTFVNALLGEAVAPMGVLPTTTTINVFRRGTGGGARVHYRDGRISTVAPEEVQTFLHGLDDTEAGRIRHVEIERSGSRMGDAAVVDTPGLNALDAFHEQVAREFLDEADAVVWVFSATRSGAASEVSMLAELRAGGRQVLGVLNKVDTLDASEQEELSAYLREQLGEVLVDIVPLRGNEALEYRTAESAERRRPLRRGRQIARDALSSEGTRAQARPHRAPSRRSAGGGARAGRGGDRSPRDPSRLGEVRRPRGPARRADPFIDVLGGAAPRSAGSRRRPAPGGPRPGIAAHGGGARQGPARSARRRVPRRMPARRRDRSAAAGARRRGAPGRRRDGGARPRVRPVGARASRRPARGSFRRGHAARPRQEDRRGRDRDAQRISRSLAPGGRGVGRARARPRPRRGAGAQPIRSPGRERPSSRGVAPADGRARGGGCSGRSDEAGECMKRTWGADEAGRGPILGPMVIAVVGVDRGGAISLAKRGVCDSKDFGAGEDARERREELAAVVRERASFAMRVVDVDEIDRYTFQGQLNALERKIVVELLADLDVERDAKIVCDGKVLFDQLRQRYPNLKAVDHGESAHVTVAAASILAKDARDKAFAEIASRYEDEFGKVVGGGYCNAGDAAVPRRLPRALRQAPTRGPSELGREQGRQPRVVLMAWIRVLSEEEVAARRDRLARLYEACVDPSYGGVDNVLKIHSLRPDSLDGHLRLYRAAMHETDGLSRREREVIAVAVSAINECHY